LHLGYRAYFDNRTGGPEKQAAPTGLVKDIDLSKDAIPFMHSRVATIDGYTVRIARISFSGELDSRSTLRGAMPAYLERLWALGHPYTDCLWHRDHARAAAEKGYIIIGQDTDGTQTPNDLNMSWIVSRKKEFIGSAPSSA